MESLETLATEVCQEQDIDYLGQHYISIDKDFQHQIFTKVINSSRDVYTSIYVPDSSLCTYTCRSVHFSDHWQMNSLTN